MQSLLDTARQQSNAGNIGDAELSLRALLEQEPGNPQAIFMLAQLLEKMLRFEEARALLEPLVEAVPNAVDALLLMGSVMIALGDADKAVTYLTKAQALAPKAKAIKAELDSAMKAQRGARKQKRRALARWPILISELDNMEEAARLYVVGKDFVPGFRLGGESLVLTLGSCFATNLAAALQKQGVNTVHSRFNEEVNSPLANRYLLGWAFDDAIPDPLRHTFDSVYGDEMKRALCSAVTKSDVIILTVGVAPCMFDVETGDLVLNIKGGASLWASSVEQRTTTVEENTSSLVELAELVWRHNPEANLVLTVSPVPLKATLEMGSVMQADCLSKSTLRVAVQSVMARLQGRKISYWPSYEMVRWLGPYYEQLFGQEDGRSRHVSARIIDMIVSLFIRSHSHSAGQ